MKLKNCMIFLVTFSSFKEQGLSNFVPSTVLKFKINRFEVQVLNQLFFLLDAEMFGADRRH